MPRLLGAMQLLPTSGPAHKPDLAIIRMACPKSRKITSSVSLTFLPSPLEKFAFIESLLLGLKFGFKRAAATFYNATLSAQKRLADNRRREVVHRRRIDQEWIQIHFVDAFLRLAFSSVMRQQLRLQKKHHSFVKKLAIKTLPCVILLRNRIVSDRLIGFEDLSGKDDFTTRALEHLLKRKAFQVPLEKGKGEDMDEGCGIDSAEVAVLGLQLVLILILNRNK
ncbi:hypothetical protein HPP92_003639 [Vanilla planifolia]|uniref:Uncharacterized protein n=1 Tax=Vanilla planifolia TaxID=51239 RepID=A0A835SGU1_VANPL|nr:hypothetical protein HPP92_003639 [Vanilla planifolia]